MAVINDELNGAVRFLPGNEKPLVGRRAVTISSAKGGGDSESRSGDTQRRERESSQTLFSLFLVRLHHRRQLASV